MILTHRPVFAGALTEVRQALTHMCSEYLPGQCDQQEHLQNTMNAVLRLL